MGLGNNNRYARKITQECNGIAWAFMKWIGVGSALQRLPMRHLSTSVVAACVVVVYDDSTSEAAYEPR